MKLKVFEKTDLMAQAATRKAAHILREAVTEKGSANFVVATGASQFGFLNYLVPEPDLRWEVTAPSTSPSPSPRATAPTPCAPRALAGQGGTSAARVKPARRAWQRGSVWPSGKEPGVVAIQLACARLILQPPASGRSSPTSSSRRPAMARPAGSPSTPSARPGACRGRPSSKNSADHRHSPPFLRRRRRHP